jgi:peptidyl-prolyl cis-trans isomerase SurA
LNDDAVFEVKERVLDLRKRILEGESFETLAILYSEDGSASEGGEIGYMAKGELDQEYAKTAFSLKKGGISKIVESEFGYHLIQLIDRRDETVNTRHILMKPRISSDARRAAIKTLDSLLTDIRQDTITFDMAAFYRSQDKNTAVNKGLVINPQSNSSKFDLKSLNPKDYLVLRDMKVGEISAPFESTDENGKVIYKVLRLKSRTDPHKANLDQDYLLIQNIALEKKKERIIQEWVKEKQKETFFHIDPAFNLCDFVKTEWLVTE